jgi:hypothetical protein
MERCTTKLDKTNGVLNRVCQVIDTESSCSDTLVKCETSIEKPHIHSIVDNTANNNTSDNNSNISDNKINNSTNNAPNNKNDTNGTNGSTNGTNSPNIKVVRMGKDGGKKVSKLWGSV